MLTTAYLQDRLRLYAAVSTLTIKVNAATVVGSPTDQGGWSVVVGTGAYGGMHGGGNLIGAC
jgi:hypothetical protein